MGKYDNPEWKKYNTVKLAKVGNVTVRLEGERLPECVLKRGSSPPAPKQPNRSAKSGKRR